jgi:hypothetical protein
LVPALLFGSAPRAPEALPPSQPNTAAFAAPNHRAAGPASSSSVGMVIFLGLGESWLSGPEAMPRLDIDC